jgi:two-component system OmpR family sensor kinase
VPGDDELARLSRTLDAMLGRLAVAFERERAFVDDASHELRTPITVLRGELELALSDLDDRGGVEQSLHAALGEAQRLSHLAEDLLVLARERAGGLVLQADPVDVRALLQRTADRLGTATGLDLRVDSAPLVLVGDDTRLEQLLANLVTNAAEAGARTVLLRGVQDGADLLLQVEDDGPGFPPGFADSAFERFTRADQARTRTTGAGLGLALVAAIAAAAGGSVRATTSGGLGGACVQVRLPLG